MPGNDPGPPSYIANEWSRFLDGLGRAGDPNTDAYIRGQVAARVQPGKTPQINIPAWNDVIRTGPRPIVTREDRETQRAFERAGLPSPLAPNIQAELARRQRFARDIPNSATPGYLGGLNQALNAVDNVQDLALTALIGARIGLGLTEAGFALAAARLSGAAAGAAGGAANLIPRLFPVIAGGLRVVGMLNWIAAAIALLGPLYALACGGPRDALSAASIPYINKALFAALGRVAPRRLGMPALRGPRGPKGKIGAAASKMPGGRRGRAPNGGRYGALSFTFAEALQAAQAAEAMTGYGLALGGVVGAVSDTAFSQARGSRGMAGGPRSPAVNHEYAALLAPRLAGLSDGALWHRQLAARTLATAPLILANPDFYGDETYILTWLMVYLAQEPVSWDQVGLPWRDIISRAGAARWRGYVPTNPVTRDELRELGRDPDDPGPWPLDGLPDELTAAHYLDELAPKIGRELVRWLEADPLDPRRAFVAEVSGSATERFWYWLEDSAEWPRWELTEDIGLLESFALSSRWPIVSDDPEAIARAWTASTTKLADEGRKWLTADELDTIWDAAGSPLLRLLPPDAPIPEAWLLPYDQATGQPGELVGAPTLEEAQALWKDYQAALEREARLSAKPPQEGP